ncbi:MAG: hypothetical protein HUU50_05765 [Candidatus Brocadiae bacterium]|nr:hypothetical protein [Candidatus Brocadiia bacterium]
MEQVYEAQKKILILIFQAGGQSTANLFKGIAYKNKAIKRLVAQRDLEYNPEGFLLTEVGRKKAEDLLLTAEQREERRKKQLQEQEARRQRQLEQERNFARAVVAKFETMLREEEGLFSLAELNRTLPPDERKIIEKNYKPLEIASRSLNKPERTWFFQGDEKDALKKIRRKSKEMIRQKWLEFLEEVSDKFDISLGIDLENPKISVSTFKKALESHLSNLRKISKSTQISLVVIERFAEKSKIFHLTTPEGSDMYLIEAFGRNLSLVLGYYLVTTAHIALYLGITRETVRRRLHKHEVSPYVKRFYSSYSYLWKDVKCLFSEPVPDVREVISHFEKHKQEWKEERLKKIEEKEKEQQEKIRQERERLLLLKDRLLAMFPVKARETDIPSVVFHVGPTNSGKTHYALESLRKGESGIYLAPLRLLAWENFEKLNAEGLPCSLLTGEEIISKENSVFASATVEMMPEKFWDVVVLDETQMAVDEQRGWAWTRVINSVRTRELHICCAPESQMVLRKFLHELGYLNVTAHKYERLCPLQIAQNPWSIERPPEGTIFVVFRRIDALALKNYFEGMKIPTSVIYGDLPPDVRRRQAERFICGESKLCVATDAIGMGMNLPAQKVCFTTLEKFDGHQVRKLTPLEIRQIAGRAGRFLLQESGEVGAISRSMLKELNNLFQAPGDFPSKVRIAPTILELEILEGPLVERFRLWLEMKAIPEHYLKLIEPCSLSTQTRLAKQIPPKWEEKLGIEKCFILVSAPVAEEIESYWKSCLQKIMEGKRLIPPELPDNDHLFGTTTALTLLENYVKEAYVFLWLGNRKELLGCISDPDKNSVLSLKRQASERIDQLLQKKTQEHIKTCRECDEPLPPLYTYSLCENCYQARRRHWHWEEEQDWEEEDDWC